MESGQDQERILLFVAEIVLNRKAKMLSQSQFRNIRR